MLKLYPKDIASFFGYKYIGDDSAFVINVVTPDHQNENSLMWAKNESTLSKIDKGTVVISSELSGKVNTKVNVIITDENSRLCFSKILNQFFSQPQNDVENKMLEFEQRKDITIGANCFIGSNVTIGEGTIIYPNVVILSNTQIGKNCLIQSNCTIGTSGLGYERLPNDVLFKFPQLGGVIIHDDVEIGPNSTIRKAAIGNTIINKGVVVGGLCNIGHNSVIGKNSLLVTQCVIGGSAVIGENCYIGINAIIKNKVAIGNNCQIAMGAVVIKDVPNERTFVGNPAEDIEDYKKWSIIKKKLMSIYKDEL